MVVARVPVSLLSWQDPSVTGGSARDVGGTRYGAIAISKNAFDRAIEGGRGLVSLMRSQDVTADVTARHDRAPLQQVHLDEADILARVRRGDRHAYGLLYERHVANARRVARAVMHRSGDVDDAVAEAFAAAFAAIRRGKGPRDCFGPYIKSCVRHECFRLMRRSGRPTHEAAAGAATGTDEFDRLDEAEVVKDAFDSLPPRMQSVLWYTEVEGLSHAEVAGATGGSSQAVAQLALRARRELTTKYLQAHLTPTATLSAECRQTRDRLAAIVRGTASRRVSTKIAAHLAGCPDCASAEQNLVSVNSRLRSTPLAALIAGIGAPALVKLGWKARLVAAISGPTTNLSAMTSVVVLSAAVGPVPSAAVPPSAAGGATLEILAGAAPLDAASLVELPRTGLLGEDEPGAAPDEAGPTGARANTASSSARPRVVADIDPVAPTATAAAAAPTTTPPPMAAVPPTTVVAGGSPTPAATNPGLPPLTGVDLPQDEPAEVAVSVGPALETEVSVSVPDPLPGTVELPVPNIDVNVTLAPTPAVTLPGGTTVLPPIDTGLGVDVGADSSGVDLDVGLDGVDLGVELDVNEGIDLDVGVAAVCLPLIGKRC